MFRKESKTVLDTILDIGIRVVKELMRESKRLQVNIQMGLIMKSEHQKIQNLTI